MGLELEFPCDVYTLDRRGREGRAMNIGGMLVIESEE